MCACVISCCHRWNRSWISRSIRSFVHPSIHPSVHSFIHPSIDLDITHTHTHTYTHSHSVGSTHHIDEKEGSIECQAESTFACPIVTLHTRSALAIIFFCCVFFLIFSFLPFLFYFRLPSGYYIHLVCIKDAASKAEQYNTSWWFFRHCDTS